MIAELEAVVSYQTLTSILVVCMTGVVGWIGKMVIGELRTIVGAIHRGDVERTQIFGKVENLELQVKHLDEKIDIKREMRNLETIVLRTLPMPLIKEQ